MATDDTRQSRSSGDATVAAALIELSLKTIRRSEEEKDHHARMEIFLRDLRQWPAEVVLKALRAWPDRSQFWPTWNELIQVISEFMPPPEPAALIEHTSARRYRSQREEFAGTIMRSDLGQDAIAGEWARFLWDFVVTQGAVPNAAQIGVLRGQAEDFERDLAKCDNPDLWPTPPANVGTWRSLGNVLGGPLALKGLGLAMRKREAELAAEYRSAA